MAQLTIHLLAAEAESWLAQVVELPGCFARGRGRDEVLAGLTTAVAAYQTRLAKYETITAVGHSPTFTIQSETWGSGHDTLLPIDEAAVSQDEVARYLQLASYQRQELLALARPLVVAMRSWRPEPGVMSIDQVLSHIASSEWWYLSRLLGKDAVPLLLNDLGQIPLFELLRAARETAVTSLPRLSAERYATLFYAPHNTRYPQEPWTVRKVLRRLLEHEREHIDHIQELLQQWRLHYLARLAAERYHLLSRLWGLDETTLATSVVEPTPEGHGLTAKDLLAHIAFWDAFYSDRLSKVVNGRLAEIQQVDEEAGLATINAQVQAQFQEVPLEQVFAMLLKERSGFVTTLHQLPNADLHRRLQLTQSWRTALRTWARRRYLHDADHAQQLAAWRQTLPADVRGGVGPSYILRALLRAGRKEFTTLVALIPAHERETRPVCGLWSLKALVDHIVGWEEVAIAGLEQLVAGQTPEFEQAILDFDAFNVASVAARQDWPWEQVWAEWQQTHQRILQLVDGMTAEAWQRPFVAPWGSAINGYRFAGIWASHPSEHARDLRTALHLTRLPAYLHH